MPTIYDEGRTVDITPESTTVTRRIRVEPYAAYTEVADLLLGGFQFFGSQWLRRPPAVDPWHQHCRAKHVNVEGMLPFGHGSSIREPIETLELATPSQYQAALLTVTYEGDIHELASTPLGMP